MFVAAEASGVSSFDDSETSSGCLQLGCIDGASTSEAFQEHDMRAL